MARIQRTAKTYISVAYRPYKGASRERYWRCPDEDTFKRFVEYEETCRKLGVPVGDPSAMFGEATKKAAGTKKDKTVNPASVARKVPTAHQWVGDPLHGKPGRFFHYSETTPPRGQEGYRAILVNWGGHFAKLPMNEVTVQHAELFMHKMLVCEACVHRATKAGRKDLLHQAHLQLRADLPPWDMPHKGGKLVPNSMSTCVDAKGDECHFPKVRRETIAHYRLNLAQLWRAAIHQGQAGREPVFASMMLNPFDKLRVPKCTDRPSPDEKRQVMTGAQVIAICAELPDWMSKAVLVGTIGMLRPSELLGLERSMVTFPTSPDDRGQAVIVLTKTFTNQGGLRSLGKNGHFGDRIRLASIATEALHEHMNTFRSTPNPETCKACALGVGEVADPRLNQHTGCDFANNCPLWIDPATGERLTPYQLPKLFKAAVAATGLGEDKLGYKLVPKMMRATGATWLASFGVSDESIAKMGRWKDKSVMTRHYHRQGDAQKADVAELADRALRAEFGLPGGDEADPVVLVAALTRRVRMLEEYICELGGDPEDLAGILRSPAATPLPLLACHGLTMPKP